jgi:hypothetical protein
MADIISPEENNAAGTGAGASETLYNEITQPVFDPSAGPAADLYRSKYTTGSNYSLAYPKDLESSKRGHAVYFDIYEVQPLGFKQVSEAVKLGLNPIPDAKDPNDTRSDENGTGTTAKPATSFEEGANKIVEATEKIIGKGNVFPGSININPRTKDNAVATIALYMPETLSFDYDAAYNKMELKAAINSVPIVGGITSALTSIMENSAVKLAMSAAGYVFNPQDQLLFEGIDFRTYQMSFTFTPSSIEETNSVNAIIKTFRYHAAPQIGGVGGFFYIPPSIFNVSFRYNGKVNPNINLLKRSVLESVSVNYAPNGWAAFEGNGAPVQTTMTLQFKETVLVDKTQIKEGF